MTLAWLINYVYVRQVLRNKQRGDRLLPNSHTRYSSSTVETVAGSGMELNFVFQPSKSSSLKRKFILEFRFERQKEKRKKGSKRVKWSLESFERFQGEIFYFERIFSNSKGSIIRGDCKRISRPGFFFFSTKLPYKHLLLINRILFHQG